MAARKSLRNRSEFSSDEEGVSQSYNKVKKKSIMTTVAPAKNLNELDITKLSDDQLRRKLFDLGYDPGPVVDSTRTVYENKLISLLISESTGDKSPNGTGNDSDQYSDSEEEVELNNRTQNLPSIGKRTFENSTSTTGSQVANSKNTSFSQSRFTSTYEDIKYPSTDLMSDQFRIKTSYDNDGLKSSLYSRKSYEKPIERSEYSQLSRPALHRDQRISSFGNSSKSASKTGLIKRYLIMFLILTFIVIFVYVVYQNMETNPLLESKLD